VPGGHAAGVAFPVTIEETAALVAAASTVLAVGAQSSLTGGATPRGELVLSTRALDALGSPVGGRVHVGAGVSLKALQAALASRHLYYPPVPTFDGAFVGGTIATNAAGAATFKYGSTRAWVAALTVVLASGDVVSLRRGDVVADGDGWLRLPTGNGEVRVRVPGYRMPAVAKLSAGYFAAPGMDLIDLFIGSEGTLGVIVDATLRVIPRPRTCTALVLCQGDDRALALTTALRDEARRAWHGGGPLDVAAIEYMDSRSLAYAGEAAFTRAGVAAPRPGEVLLLVQLEVPGDEAAALTQFADVLAACGIDSDPIVAMPDDASGAARLFELREAVPAGVNATIGSRKQRQPGLQKTAGDMVVPFERLSESLSLYRRAFEARGLEYAIWGHVSDGNLHPNVVPATLADVEKGVDAIREIGRDVTRMGGAPLAEHGVGRSPLKQALLRDMYGEEGLEDMRAIKRALDPTWKLAPGVLFPAPGRE
jgi:D-lactate dehydrogenase (cytochrome)